VANPVSRSTTVNKVVWGKTSTEVNLLLRILLRTSLAEPKAKSKKMSPTNPAEEEEKAEVKVEAGRGLKRKKKTYYRAVLLSLMISLIRWVTQVFQPSLV
jgi:hypothetical protein